MSEAEYNARAEAAKARLAELNAARAEKDAKRAAERAELEVADAEALAKAEAEFGEVGRDISPVYTDLGVIIVKRAHPATLKAFSDSNKVDYTECRKLVRPCVVHPDVKRFDEMLELQPLVLASCAEAVANLGGARAKAAAPK